ncbi:Alcohol dehydrogenase transcription factor Myb/SANT-like [Popillia japonica]|uniref:Alcohol dehydrogenase transcription factor Myb/SANT-like n=1 Tax=Popillia japonica TaxID=7064 RepID=A0AAW1JT69_POPJA
MAPKFSAIEDEKLINAIGLHRAIYDSENVDYKNQHIKDNIWEVIAKETERSVDDCKKRWKCIRDSYLKINKKRWKCIRDSYLKIKKSQKTTTGQAAIKRPKWSVNTLQPVEEDSIGTDTGNLDFQEQHKNSVNEPSSQNEDEDETTSIQSTPSTKSTINRDFKKRQQRTSDSKLLEELKKRSADRTAFMRKILEDEDEVDIFMHSIAVQVKKLNPQLIAEAKVGILSLVNRLQFRGTLEPTTSPSPYSSSSSNCKWAFAVENCLLLDGLNGCIKEETAEAADKIAQARAKLLLTIDPALFIHVKERKTAAE